MDIAELQALLFLHLTSQYVEEMDASFADWMERRNAGNSPYVGRST